MIVYTPLMRTEETRAPYGLADRSPPRRPGSHWGGAPRAGWLIVEARRRAGLTQRQLADRASVPQSTISVYERGGREPTLPTLARLVGAAGFRVELDLVPIGIDLERNARVLREVLGLVDMVPRTARRGALSFPRIPSMVGR